MSLTGALQVARSGLSAGQLGIQVTGNNIANAATPGYSRQLASLAPAAGDRNGVTGSVGRGVLVRDVRRQVDQSLLARLWASGGSGASAAQQQQILEQLEATLGELGDNSLSSQLTGLFRTWSERANQTSANAVVVQQADQIAHFMGRLRADLVDQRRQVDGQLGAAVSQANGLLRTIADLNRQISQAEVGGGHANSLRDQRDQAITSLSELVDVSVIDHATQGVDVLVGSVPVVLAGRARELEVRRDVQQGEVSPSVAIQEDGQRLRISGGQLGGLLQGRSDVIDSTIEQLDRIAAQLAFEVNKLHATGRNLTGLGEMTSTIAMTGDDRLRALNDPLNGALAGLPFGSRNGSFQVTVRDSATGATTTATIKVDLDGVRDDGTSGFDDDTSAEDIRAALDGVDGLSATFTADGKLRVRAAPGFEVWFAQDSSDALATLGVNAFYEGSDASSLAVRGDLLADPSRLASGRDVDGVFIENGTALRIAQLADAKLGTLGGQSITESWRATADAVGVATAGARSATEASGVVREALLAQRDAFSGVSIDEESINLLNYQRQYQGAARVISVTDQLTQVLLNLV